MASSLLEPGRLLDVGDAFDTVPTLLLTEVFPPQKGGSGRWLWELYRRQPRGDVHVIAGNWLGSAEFDSTADLDIERVALRFSNWGVSRPRAAREYARAFFRVHRAVRRNRPAAIHCGKSLPEGLIAYAIHRLMGVPYWCYAHGEELTLARMSSELRWLNDKVLSNAARIVANSQHSKDMLVNDWRVPGERITVVHPGVDTTRFCPSPRDAALRARLGWHNRQVVLTVGALQKRKGQDMFIRALPAIRRRCPTVLYTMIGEGWEREYLDGLVREYDVADAVQFRGAPDDAELLQCYQQCDLFALPNRRVEWDFEGFGIALLEAQACGKPVVAGLSGGTAETMKVPETGALVACETPQPLADTVCALLADPERRAAMGERAREWVVSTFDWDVVAAGGARSAPTVQPCV